MKDWDPCAIQVCAPRSIGSKASYMRSKPLYLQETGRLDKLPFRASDSQLAHHQQDPHRRVDWRLHEGRMADPVILHPYKVRAAFSID